MRKLHLMLIVVAAVLSLTAIPAFADQLTLGGDGTVFFCSTGGPNSPIVLSTTPGCTTAGGTVGSTNSGTFESPTGNTVVALQPWHLVFPSTNPFEFGSLVGNVFSVVSPQNVTAFSWGGNGTGTITGNVIWTIVKDGTDRPQFMGDLVITGNGNTGQLLAEFPVGLTMGIDFTINLGGNPQLDDVFASGAPAATNGRFSSGEVPSVPEPGTALLMGAGLLVAGTFLRRRGRA